MTSRMCSVAWPKCLVRCDRLSPPHGPPLSAAAMTVTPVRPEDQATAAASSWAENPRYATTIRRRKTRSVPLNLCRLP